MPTAGTDSTARPWLRPLLWAVLAATLLGVGGLATYQQLRQARRLGPGGGATALLPELGSVPDFALADRDGRIVRRADLLGAPWIADFVFTTCASSCPLLSARMARLDRELPAGGALRLVSFSVDPAHDTPPVLAAYARTFAASRRWLFLTGPEGAVRRLSRAGFKLALEPAASPPPGGPAPGGPAAGGPVAGGPAPGGQTDAPAEAILHSTRFVLVDAHGVIRGTYPALEPDALARLAADARALAATH